MNAINEMQSHLSGTEKNIIILICDGDVDNNAKTKKIIKTAQNEEKPINIYTLNVVDGASEVLESIANLTGGYSYKAKTSDEIEAEMKKLQNKTVYSVDTTDSDGDGIYDTYEINGIRTQNGKVIKTDPNKADTDGDGLSDGVEIGLIAMAKELTFYGQKYSCVLCNPNSSPISSDYDGDGFADDIDPEPYDKTFIKDFGSAAYIENVKWEAENEASILYDYSISTFLGDYLFYKINHDSMINKNKLDIMMNDVNNCPYTYLVSDENWLNFCLFFNECVDKYGTVDEELHYFRLKLNRAPATLEEMIDLINSTPNINDKWIMCSPYKGRYHMYGDDGAHNIKFISSNNTDNIYEAVYDINGKIITEKDDYGKNMGTYNYISSSKYGKKHTKYDVKTYEKMMNTFKDLKYNTHENANNNVTSSKDPALKNDATQVDLAAKAHYEDMCEAIGIDYTCLVKNDYSDKCYK